MRPPGNFQGIYESLYYNREWFGDRPTSDWLETEKNRAYKELTEDSYEILIVPVQPIYTATDPIGRSLMDRYLYDAMVRSVTRKIAPLEKVRAALGSNYRVYREDEILRLAKDLHAAIILEPHAGKLELLKPHTVLLQKYLEVKIRTFRRSNHTGELEYQADNLYSWNDLPFTHTHLPYQVFRDIIPEILAKLDVKQRAAPVAGEPDAEIDEFLPGNINEIIGSSGKSVLQDACLLQYLAALHPDAYDRRRERLFERSLLITEQLGPTSPFYRLLRARALFHLHRRPAAIAALGEPSTPEERFSKALMDGNIMEAETELAEISIPLFRLLSVIEFQHLKYKYSWKLDQNENNKIAAAYGEMGYFIQRILDDANWWKHFSNVELKKQLDKYFPLAGYTAEDLLLTNLTVKHSVDDNVEFGKHVVTHVHRLLESESESGQVETGTWPANREDVLTLFISLAENTLEQDIVFQDVVQGEPESALEILDEADVYFSGHPYLAALACNVLSEIYEREQGQSRKNRYLDMMDQCKNAILWAEGQSNVVNFSSRILEYRTKEFTNMFPRKDENRNIQYEMILLSNYFTPDFPGRPVYSSSSANVYNDKMAEYTHDDIELMYETASSLSRSSGKSEALEFLAANEHRFQGHPQSDKLKIKLYRELGEEIDVEGIYLKAVQDGTRDWTPYEELGIKYIENGDYARASEIYLQYPPFSKPGDENRVWLSNISSEAGSTLFWRGAVDYAKPLFEISRDYSTGSEGYYQAMVRLALLNEDFQEAARLSLARANRYNSSDAYRVYLNLLHVFGFHNEAWSIFNRLIIDSDKPHYWSSAFVGHRMTATSDKEIGDWVLKLTSQQDNPIMWNFLYAFALKALLIARNPDPYAHSVIEELTRNRDIGGAKFLDAYNAIKTGDYSQAYQLIMSLPSTDPLRWTPGSIAASHFPYLIWAGIKSGVNQNLLQQYITAYDDYYRNERIFNKTIAEAYFEGGRGNHDAALKNLKFAFNINPNTDYNVLFPWYEIVEACEWLYRDSTREEYRELLLKWARDYQVIQPWFGWAYAIEVKYTDDPERRQHSLAYALYLDKHSAYLTDVTEEEKKAALQWLDVNNKFTLESGSRKVDSI